MSLVWVTDTSHVLPHCCSSSEYWLQYQAYPSSSLYHGLHKRTLNGNNTISCMVPVFHGNDIIPFPGIRERKMTGILRRPGNGSPGIHTLVTINGLLVKLTAFNAHICPSKYLVSFKRRLDIWMDRCGH